MGISAGHVVVGFAGIKRGGADQGFQCLEARTVADGNAEADLRADVREGVERRERGAHHRVDVERAGRLIERPEGFAAIGVERGELRERCVRQVTRREVPLIQRAQEPERVEARPFESRAQIGRRRRVLATAAADHAATWTNRN